MTDMGDAIEDRLDRLESLVEDQQATIEQQRDRIADLEREASRKAAETDDGDRALVDRRDALKAGGLLALLFGGVGTASADPQGQVGTSSDPLQTLYTEELNGGVAGDNAVTDLPGNGLTISDGSLGIASGGVDTDELASDSVTVAGNAASLGGSTAIDHGDLAGIGSSDHHTKPTAGTGLSGTDTFSVEPADFAGQNLTANDGTLDYVPPENVIVVAKIGGDYSDVPTALSNASSPDVVWVAPGEYEVSATDIPSGVTLVGASRTSTVLYNNSYSGLNLSNSCEIRSLTVEQRSDPTGAGSVIEMDASGEVRIQDVTIQTTISARWYGIQSYDGTLTLQNVTVWMGNNSRDTGVSLFDNSGDPTADIRNSILKGGSDSSYDALSVDNGLTANVANSQIINGIGGLGTVNQFGNYDGGYNAL